MKWDVIEYSVEHEEKVIDLVEMFHVEHLHKVAAPFDRESFRGYLHLLVSLPGHRIFLLTKDGAPVGVVGVFIAESMFNKSHLDMAELMWYVEPGFRMRGVMLYKRLLAEAKTAGVSYIRMVYMHNDVKEKVASFYRNDGFVEMETHCVKKL